MRAQNVALALDGSPQRHSGLYVYLANCSAEMETGKAPSTVRSRQEQVVAADYLFFPSQVQICLIQPGPIGCRDPLRATCSKTYCTGRCVVGKSTRELYKFTNK